MIWYKMVRISSTNTFFNKRVFPAIWFGFLAVFFVASAIGMIAGKHSNPLFLIVPIGMAVFGYFLMRALVFDLVDEVWDDEDALVVRNRGIEETILLKDIVNVNYSGMTNPPRITLTLREESLFGPEIKFSPPQSWFPFMQPQIVKDLVQRIDEERRNANE